MPAIIFTKVKLKKKSPNPMESVHVKMALIKGQRVD